MCGVENEKEDSTYQERTGFVEHRNDVVWSGRTVLRVVRIKDQLEHCTAAFVSIKAAKERASDQGDFLLGDCGVLDISVVSWLRGVVRHGGRERVEDGVEKSRERGGEGGRKEKWRVFYRSDDIRRNFLCGNSL